MAEDEVKNFPTIVPVVALALFDGDGLVLMQQRPLHKAHGGKWEFPGGKVEAGETLESALVREIREELAIELATDSLQPVNFAARSDQPHVVLLYSCTRWQGDVIPQEGQAFGWFALDQLAMLEMPPLDVPLAATLCLASKRAK